MHVCHVRSSIVEQGSIQPCTLNCLVERINPQGKENYIEGQQHAYFESMLKERIPAERDTSKSTCAVCNRKQLP